MRRVAAIAAAVVLILAGALGAYVVLERPAAPLPPTFAQAREAANGSMVHVLGGGWSLLLAVGVDQRTAANVSVSGATNSTVADCTAKGIGGNPLPSSLNVPGYGESFGAGRAPLWLFVYRQPSSGDYVLADVLGSDALAVGQLTGTACTSNLSSFSPIPAKFSDSPSVAASAWSGSVDAQGFAAGDPAIDTLVMVAAGPSTDGPLSLPAGWVFDYMPCSPFATGTLTNETTFYAAFNATGAVLLSSTGHTGCPA